MKKTCFTKIALLVLAMVICLAVAVPGVNAAVPEDESVIQPQNIAINTTSNSLTVYNASTKTLDCLGSTTVQPAYKAKVTVELQKLLSSTGWTTQKTWTATGGTYAGLEKYPSVSSGTYRLKLTHEALSGSGAVIETIIKYSNIITVP